MDYAKMFRNAILIGIEELSLQCVGCPQESICEEQENDGEARYCWPLIEAAILGKDTFETYHKKVLDS